MTRFDYVRPHPSSHLLSLTDAERIAVGLRRGSLAVLPTETGYMLAALATSPTAIARAFTAKGRHAANVMHVACASLEMANTAGVLTPEALRLLGGLTPGPVTVIVEKTPLLPDDYVTLNGTVGIRIPDHPATLQVIAHAGAPLTATSLNMSGTAPSPLAEFDLGTLDWPADEVTYVVSDDDSIVFDIPSTLVRLSDGKLEILRVGPIPEPEIRRVAEGQD
ncbi:MAG TPA: L-threonylcarbamoyladenylate synthase [Streptosporangiaceae bacterium]|nr:L-threonylcarbamoyladenylate synthase [Streptosporangiaceae bacterium]